MNLKNLLIATAMLGILSASSGVLAKGEMSVEYPDGETDIYEEMQIFHTPDTLYLKDASGINTVVISKAECTKEGQLLYCDRAKVFLENYGVSEEIVFTQLALFINETSSRQEIQGSRLVLKPKTILLEGVTKKGTFITAFGKIDSTEKPPGLD